MSNRKVFILLASIAINVVPFAVGIGQESAVFMRISLTSLMSNRIEEFSLTPSLQNSTIDVVAMHRYEGHLRQLQYQIAPEANIDDIFDSIAGTMRKLPFSDRPSLKIEIQLEYQNGLRRCAEISTHAAMFGNSGDSKTHKYLAELLTKVGKQTSRYIQLAVTDDSFNDSFGPAQLPSRFRKLDPKQIKDKE